MKKVILGTVLAVSLAMANTTPKDDLLAMATMGKTTGSQFEMSKSEMKDADGGWYYTTRKYSYSSFRSIAYSNYFYSSWYKRLNKW